MMEARFLTGNPQLFQQFHSVYFRKVVTAGVDKYLDQKVAERRREYQKFGETVYLLEPNVKKSKGGLRDLHLLQWTGLARYQAPTIRELSDRGILSPGITRSSERRVSSCLRFGRCSTCIRAWRKKFYPSMSRCGWLERFGFEDRPHLLAVEQFMQRYYRHTMGLQEAADRFVGRCKSQSLWEKMRRWLPASKVDTHFVLRGESLTVPAEARSRVLGDPALLMRLFDLARSRRLSIDTALLEDIHRHVEGLVRPGIP